MSGTEQESEHRPPSLAETLLVRYGAGAHLIARITNRKSWNLISWILIVLGVAGWIVGLWLCSPYPL